MRKPHKAWWADKRNKDLATNEEGLKYAPDICNLSIIVTEDEYRREKYIQDKFLELDLIGFDDGGSRYKHFKYYKSAEEFNADMSLAEDCILDYREIPQDIENKLKAEIKYQKSLESTGDRSWK